MASTIYLNVTNKSILKHYTKSYPLENRDWLFSLSTEDKSKGNILNLQCPTVTFEKDQIMGDPSCYSLDQIMPQNKLVHRKARL